MAGMRFGERLDAGGVLYGASTALHSETVVELYGELGFDYVFVDFEHSGPSVWDTPMLESFTRAAEAAGVDLVVRLPSGEPGAHPPLVRKVLDAGVRNVVLPRVETAETVEAAVAASQFSYRGESGDRGVGVARGSDWGGSVSPEWIDAEDDAVRCGVMIENRTAVENVDEILAVPGLGFVFVGSMDLSVSLGHPTETDSPGFRECVETVREACLDAGVPFGQMGVELSTSAALVESGAQLVHVGSDIGAIRESLATRLERVRG